MLCDASALAPHCACGSASWRLTHVTQTQSVQQAQPFQQTHTEARLAAARPETQRQASLPHSRWDHHAGLIRLGVPQLADVHLIGSRDVGSGPVGGANRRAGRGAA
jgi:hypothetical protein